MNKKCDKVKSGRPIHIVIHEEELRRQVVGFLRKYAERIKSFKNVNHFLDIPIEPESSCLITSLDITRDEGKALLNHAAISDSIIPIVVIATNDENVYSAVKSMQAGALDYFQQPLMERDFIERIDKIVQRNK